MGLGGSNQAAILAFCPTEHSSRLGKGSIIYAYL